MKNKTVQKGQIDYRLLLAVLVMLFIVAFFVYRPVHNKAVSDQSQHSEQSKAKTNVQDVEVESRS